ncbi:MAG: N-acetyltransferase [Thermoplasmata archaeon]|nr:GNAT family N-acetyltransferase [Euryarchaeota archaeon]RLF65991.1 MAG: N-acetyltransferase [Thermoplasmata archaeon]
MSSEDIIPANIVIRKVDESLVESFYRVYKEAYFRLGLEEYAYTTKSSIVGYFWWLINRDRDGFRVAEMHGIPVGFVACDANWYSKYEGDYVAEVHEIVVHPDYQGLGIGRRLMEAALNYGKSRGRKVSELWVGVENHNARRFYKRLGFEEREIKGIWLRMVKRL